MAASTAESQPVAKEATVQRTATTDPRAGSCAERPAPSGAAPSVTVAVVAATVQPLFPPRDADAEARRRWLASSPWPEVVFASAAAR